MTSIEQEAFEFVNMKRKSRKFLSEPSLPFGPQLNKVEQYMGMKVGDQVQCIDAPVDHQIRKFDLVKINMIENDNGVFWIYYMTLGWPFRVEANRFISLEEQ